MQEQLAMARRKGGFGGMPGGGAPKGTFGALAGLIFLGGAMYIGNNALFNGRSIVKSIGRARADSGQSTVVTERSSTQE